MNKETKLKLAIALSSVFLLVEVFGGYIANSLAIYSDAAHLLTDIAGFAISLVAVIAAKRPGCKDYTYGLVRAEVFGALASILSLWVITAILVYEAYYRGLAWFEGRADYVNGKLMFFVAVFGVFVNLCLGFVFSSEHGGAFHPAHSHGDHDHGGACGGHHGSHKDEETGHGHDHGHGHGGHDSKKVATACTDDHDHGHGHGAAHGKPSEATSLVAGAQKAGYSKVAAHDEEDGHSHAHAPSSNNHGHDHSSCSSHEEEDRHHGSHDHHESTPSAPPPDFDANIQAAYLHVLTDLIQSIGVAFAGLVIWLRPQWQVIDPICTFCFSILVLSYTLPLINRIANVLLEGKPSHIDWHLLETRLKAIDGVQDVHDLHVWSISSNSCAMTVHIMAYNPQAALVKAHKVCKDMNIQHATIQVQDAAAGNIQQCLSDMCVGDTTCVIATPSSYLTGGF